MSQHINYWATTSTSEPPHKPMRLHFSNLWATISPTNEPSFKHYISIQWATTSLTNEPPHLQIPNELPHLKPNDHYISNQWATRSTTKKPKHYLAFSCSLFPGDESPPPPPPPPPLGSLSIRTEFSPNFSTRQQQIMSLKIRTLTLDFCKQHSLETIFSVQIAVCYSFRCNTINW